MSMFQIEANPGHRVPARARMLVRAANALADFGGYVVKKSFDPEVVAVGDDHTATVRLRKTAFGYVAIPALTIATRALALAVTVLL